METLKDQAVGQLPAAHARLRKEVRMTGPVCKSEWKEYLEAEHAWNERSQTLYRLFAETVRLIGAPTARREQHIRDMEQAQDCERIARERLDDASHAYLNCLARERAKL